MQQGPKKVSIEFSDSGPVLTVLENNSKSVHRYDGSKTTSKWDPQIEAFEAADRITPPHPGAVLFAGSSSIRLWDLAGSFPDIRTINRGFGGSHIAHTNRYFHRIVLPCRPAIMVFYAGDNDLSVGKPVERLVTDLAWLIWKSAFSLPGMRLVFLSLKPSPELRNILPEVIQYNFFLNELCRSAGPDVHYVDIFGPMMKDHMEPDRRFFADDGLHMSQHGYCLWTEIIRPFLADDTGA